jgi:hypothetical protein
MSKSTNPVLAISLLASLVAISATAHAASTITDKSYWPSAARPIVHAQTSTAHSQPRDAFASSAYRDLSASNPGSVEQRLCSTAHDFCSDYHGDNG